MAKKQAYGNESITTLKGAERVRKRPAVIFGSDGLDGCEHAVFEILSNAIDEAREGYGKLIIVTRYADPVSYTHLLEHLRVSGRKTEHPRVLPEKNEISEFCA